MNHDSLKGRRNFNRKQSNLLQHLSRGRVFGLNVVELKFAQLRRKFRAMNGAKDGAHVEAENMVNHVIGANYAGLGNGSRGIYKVNKHL